MSEPTDLTTSEMNRLLVEYQLHIPLSRSLVPPSKVRDAFAAAIPADMERLKANGQTLLLPNDLDDDWAPDPPYDGPVWDSEKQKLVPREK